MTTHAQQQGKMAEQKALNYLQAQGLTLITHNFHCRRGEIDLIFITDNTLIFVEVRLRRHTLVSAAESITPQKQQRIVQCAQYFLTQHPHYQHCNLRFDVVLFDAIHSKPQWITGAFDATLT